MKDTTIQLAKKQRHILLLEKVKANKALTPAEVRELEGYEAEHQPLTPTPPAATDERDMQRVREVRAKAKKRAKRVAKAPAAKRTAPLTPARVRRLALDQEDLTAAAAHLGRAYDLVTLLAVHPELEREWRRGRLLRNLRRLAGKGTTIHEAAHDLGLPVEELQRLVTTDIEVANHWNEARLETALMLKGQWLQRAAEGNVRAIAQVEAALRNEIAHAAMDIHTVPEEKMCEICGVTRQTLNRWLREEKMPRNAGETTYDLPTVWGWFEGFVKHRCQGVPAPEANPLQAVKAERLELELRARKGELVEVESVKAGLLARERALLAVLEHRPEELAQMLAGKTKQEIKPVLEKFVEDLRREWVAAAKRETTNEK